MTVYRQALLIRGLSWQSSQYPTLFTDGDLDKTSLPAGYGPLSDANLQIVPRLAGGSISGATWTSSIREPVGVGSSPSCRLIEDSSGSFAKIFAPDPGYKATTVYEVYSGLTYPADSTDLLLFGEDSPTSGSIIWLEKEAIRIGTVTSTGQTNSITGCTRGACGSLARKHQLDPDQFGSGDSLRDCLLASTRMLWDDTKFEATLYVFAMSEEEPASVASTLWVWNGHIEERPTLDVKYQQWEVQVAHVTKAIAEHTIGSDSAAVELDSAVIVVSEVGASDTAANGISATVKRPQKVKLRLRRDQAERLFRVPLHALFSNYAYSGELSSAIVYGSPSVSYQIVGEVGGYTWLWQVDSAGFFDLGSVLDISASLIAQSPLASIRDNPTNYTGTTATGYDPLHPDSPSPVPSRNDNMNQGFCKNPASALIRFDQGETPPKIRLRTKINKTFPDALATWLLSGFGGGVNHASYDVLVGGRGMYLDPDWVQIGSPPVNPLAVDLGTAHIAEHAALHNEPYDYIFEPGVKLGDWLKNELYLHTSLFGYIPSTGKVTFRKWIRPLSASTLTPLVGNANLSETSERLPALRALFLERGYDPITLEPKFRKPIRLKGANAKDVSEALSVRVWKQGSEFTDAELASGPLANMEAALFSTTMGTPNQHEIHLPLSEAVVFADQKRWTNSTVPTPSGVGLSAAPVVVIGQDFRWEQGKQVVRVMLDVVNDAIESAPTKTGTGVVGGALRVTGIVSADHVAGQYTLEVDSILQPIFDITKALGEFWNTAAIRTEAIRVVTLSAHNPSGAGERQGPLELSATLTAVEKTTGGANRITFSVDGAWERGGFTFADIIKKGSIILPQDPVPAIQSPTGVSLERNSASGVSGVDLIQFSIPRKPAGRKHLIA